MRKHSFIYKKCKEGTFGVFADYPNAPEVLEAIICAHGEFPSYMRRSKSRLELLVQDSKLSLYVKGKQGNLAVLIGKDRKVPDTYPSSGRTNSRSFSVMHELTVNRKVQVLYREKYGVDLRIEQPVGYFISDSYERWVIFEELKGVLEKEHCSDVWHMIQEMMKKYQREIFRELNAIGVRNNAYSKTLFDLVPVHDPEMEDPVFALVDSEDWCIQPR